MAWEAIGGFDEQFYPVWFEDVDFCKRLRDMGFVSCTFPLRPPRTRAGIRVRNAVGRYASRSGMVAY